MKELTRAEEQVMQVLWEIKKGFIHDLLGKMPEPKPAYNTVSTIIRILEQKGFVDHKAYGRTYEYFPLISKKDYTRAHFRNFMANYFDNSYQSLASFFTRDEKISREDMEEIRRMMDEALQNEKGGRS